MTKNAFSFELLTVRERDLFIRSAKETQENLQKGESPPPTKNRSTGGRPARCNEEISTILKTWDQFEATCEIEGRRATVREFCRAHSLSERSFYAMKRTRKPLLWEW